MKQQGLPKRQRLVGLWLLLVGTSLLGGALFASWLDTELALRGFAHYVLWLGCFSGGATLLLAGLLLERMLFAPLRQLQEMLAQVVANPEHHSPTTPGGWLNGLAPDLNRISEGWQRDREQLHSALEEGGRRAEKRRRELESVLQLLDLPLLLCDRHNRLILINSAAEDLFGDHAGLGLGRRLETLMAPRMLIHTLSKLPDNGACRDILVPWGSHWLQLTLRRIPPEQHTLISCRDVTAAWSNEVGIRAAISHRLTPLRQHTNALVNAIEALEQLSPSLADPALRHQLTTVATTESARLCCEVSQVAELFERFQQQSERMSDIWSNDFWQALDERLDPSRQLITPVGVPGWFRADISTLVAMMGSLLEQLASYLPAQGFEGEVSIGKTSAHIDIILSAGNIAESELVHWRGKPIDELPLQPTANDILRQHASELWSQPGASGSCARLRLALPLAARQSAPLATPPRPEFHDFTISTLPPPDEALGQQALRSLTIVAFDTETTGLDLRGRDTIISIGACRIVNARLLARETFHRYVDPRLPIPAASTAIHGITDQDVSGAPPLAQVLGTFRDYVGEAVLLAHNADFDLLAIRQHSDAFSMPIIDTLLLSRALDEALEGHDLDSLARRYALNVPPGMRHSALGDAQLTATLWLVLLARLEARGIETLGELLTLQASVMNSEDASAP